MTGKKLTLGLAGGMCSGKNTFGDYLVAHHGEQFGGGKVVSSSDAARAFIAEHALGEPTRDLTRVVSTQLRQTYSPHYMVDWALSQFNNEGLRIIAGIYTPAEAGRIREVGGMVVAVVADVIMRENRMVGRSRSGETVATDFRRLDNEDMSATQTDQNLAAVLQNPDIVIHDIAGRSDELYQAASEQILTRYVEA